MPLLDAKATGVPRLPPLEVQSEAIATLTVQSGGVTNVPSLRVQTEGIQKVSSVQMTPGTVTKVPSLQVVSNSKTPSPETKTEAVSTTSPTVTSPIQRSPDAGVSQASSFVTTQTISKVDVPSVTGTGSVTATPTVFTTAITTTASSTTTTSTSSGQEGSPPSILGKRVRRQSTKYEDYEQQSLTVCVLVHCVEEELESPLLVLSQC